MKVLTCLFICQSVKMTITRNNILADIIVIFFISITDQNQKENLGIVVQYKVKVRLILGFGSRLVQKSTSFIVICLLHYLEF